MRRRGREARHLDGDLQGARGARRRDDELTQCAVRDLVEDHLQPMESGGVGKCFSLNVSLIYGNIPDTWIGIYIYTFVSMLVYDISK